MSGPKCFGVAATERERERCQRQCEAERLLSKYERLYNTLDNPHAVDPMVVPPSVLRGEVERSFRAWQDEVAVEVLQHLVGRLAAARQLRASWSEEEANSGAGGLVASYQPMIGSSLNQQTMPSEPDTNRRREAEQALEAEIAERRANFTKAVKAASRRERSTQSLEDILANLKLAAPLQRGERRHSPRPSLVAGSTLAEKIAVLRGSIKAHPQALNEEEWEDLRDLLARAAAACASGDEEGAVRQYEAAQLEFGRLSRVEQRSVDQAEQLAELADELAPFRGFELADDLGPRLAEAAEQARAGLSLDLTLWRETVQHIVQAGLPWLESRRRRRALLESLHELGYEPTGSPLQTALVEGGRLVLRKSGDEDYGLEVVATPEVSAVQTAIVRFDGPEPGNASRDQLLRDKEREEAWCGEHAALREKLANEHGLQSSFQMKHHAGEYPVRVVRTVDEETSRPHRKDTTRLPRMRREE